MADAPAPEADALAKVVQPETPAENPYWAADKSDTFGKKLDGRLTKCREALVNSNHINHVLTAYVHFYGQDIEGVGADASAVVRTGEQGELAEIRIPQARALALGVANIITGAKVAWNAMAANNDHKSKAGCITASTALEYYWKDKAVFGLGVETVLQAVPFGEAFLFAPFNPELGEARVALKGKAYTDGDIDFDVIPTWDYIRDPNYKAYRQLPWEAVTRWENKYDVAASAKDEATRTQVLSRSGMPTGLLWQPNAGTASMVEPDVIPVTYWYHKRTPALPEGRQVRMVEGGVVLDDQPLRRAYWRFLPIHRYSVGELAGTPFPHSSFWDALAACQVADSILTSLATNVTTTAPGLLAAEAGSEIAPDSVVGGPKVLYYKAGSKPPQEIALQQASPDQFRMLDTCRREAERILNLNPTAFGQTEAGKALSGAAYAMLASMSIQNNSNLQGNWVDFVTHLGNGVLDIWRHEVTTPKKISIAGKGRSSSIKAVELGPKQLEGVDRVLVEIGNPLQQTAAGRLELAQLFLGIQGFVRTPEQLQALVDTGRMDPLTQDLSNQLLLISEENEAMADGKAVAVVLTDDHRLHLREHPGVAANMEQRTSPEVMKVLQAHIAEHVKILRETDPAILQAIGQQPLAPAAPPGGPAGAGPGAPSPDAAPEAGMPPPPAPQDAAAAVKLPQMPTNPSTGEPFQPANGAPVQ